MKLSKHAYNCDMLKKIKEHYVATASATSLSAL